MTISAEPATQRDYPMAAALLAVIWFIGFCSIPTLAQDTEQSHKGPELLWLQENFSGPFTWTMADPESGEDIQGSGHCNVAFELFLRCVHRSPEGEEIGVGISGYHEEKQKHQWTYYGAGSSAMLHGEGTRDAEAGTSIIEGTQKIAGLPEFTFRTVTSKIADGLWQYVHYRVAADTLIEMFRATFSYQN